MLNQQILHQPTLLFTFCSIKGEKGKALYSCKQRYGPCSVYPSPKGVRETLAQSETRVKIAQSNSQVTKNLK